MGCGGSKQQDVATGNTVSTGQLSQKESSATTKSDASSATADVGTAEGSLKPVIEKAEITNANGSSNANEKPTTTTAALEVAEEAHLLTNETPNEYLSPRKDAEMVEEDGGGSEGVDYLLPRKDYDANVVGVDGVEELKESETKKAQEVEKGEVGLKIDDDDGDSIGKHSNDFKEALFVEETDEGNMDIAEKKNIGEDEAVNGSSAQ